MDLQSLTPREEEAAASLLLYMANGGEATAGSVPAQSLNTLQALTHGSTVSSRPSVNADTTTATPTISAASSMPEKEAPRPMLADPEAQKVEVWISEWSIAMEELKRCVKDLEARSRRGPTSPDYGEAINALRACLRAKERSSVTEDAAREPVDPVTRLADILSASHHYKLYDRYNGTTRAGGSLLGSMKYRSNHTEVKKKKDAVRGAFGKLTDLLRSDTLWKTIEELMETRAYSPDEGTLSPSPEPTGAETGESETSLSGHQVSISWPSALSLANFTSRPIHASPPSDPQSVARFLQEDLADLEDRSLSKAEWQNVSAPIGAIVSAAAQIHAHLKGASFGNSERQTLRAQAILLMKSCLTLGQEHPPSVNELSGVINFFLDDIESADIRPTVYEKVTSYLSFSASTKHATALWDDLRIAFLALTPALDSTLRESILERLPTRNIPE